MDTNKYTSALDQQYAALGEYIKKSVSAIRIPAKGELQEGKHNFLTKSGWTYIVIGVIAFIAGLILDSSAIWITGCAAVTAGVYCIIKGKQQLKAEAYVAVGNAIVQAVDKTVAYVSKSWTDFVVGQNIELRGEAVASEAANADKVKALGWLTDSSWVHVNVDAITADLKKIDAAEALDGYSEYLPKVTSALAEDLKLAYIAQKDVLKGMSDSLSATTAAAKPATAQTVQTK